MTTPRVRAKQVRELYAEDGRVPTRDITAFFNHSMANRERLIVGPVVPGRDHHMIEIIWDEDDAKAFFDHPAMRPDEV